MKRSVPLLAWTVALAVCGAVDAQVYGLPQVPGVLPVPIRVELIHTRAALAHELRALQARSGRFNARCASVDAGSPQAGRCAAEDAELEARRARFNSRAARYGREIHRAARLTPDSAMVWSASGGVTLERGGRSMPAAGRLLRTGDCLSTHSAGIARIILPHAVLFTFGPGGRFCYLPQRIDSPNGLAGYLYRLERGREVKIPIEVTGVRG